MKHRKGEMKNVCRETKKKDHEIRETNNLIFLSH